MARLGDLWEEEGRQEGDLREGGLLKGEGRAGVDREGGLLASWEGASSLLAVSSPDNRW